MQAKKRRLEKELQLEERRVKLLEERLNETERARDDAHELIITIERGVIRFQAFVRRRQALRLFRKLQHESAMRELVAKFFQCRYRGWKGRERAVSRREYLREKQRIESAATIQANERRRFQRKTYLNLLMEQNRLNNQSAASIQAMLRGNMARQLYLTEICRRQDAATNTQRVWRGTLARLNAERMRQEVVQKRIEVEKPKRVPLHLRKYSTYGAGVPRRANGTKKRDVRMRRRSSDAMISLNDGRLSSLANLKSSSSFGDPDENDSVASTSTSLTGADDRRTHRIRNNAPSWSSSMERPPRLTAINRRNTSLNCTNKLNSGRRSSLERRRTITGLSSPLHSQRPLRERQPTLETCHDSDDSSRESTPRERQESTKSKSPQEQIEDLSAADRPKNSASSALAREKVKTPITLSEEASFIVQEVLGKSVMRHSIMHSGFDDEFSEHEDDLE